MKNKSLIILLIFLNLSSFAQVFVGRGEHYRDSKSESEALEQLRKTTLIIPVPNSLTSRIDELEKIYSKVWTLTPIEVVEYQAYESIKDQMGYSFLDFRYNTSLTFHQWSFESFPMPSSRCNMDMHLWMYDMEPENPDKPRLMHFATIDVTIELDRFMETHLVSFKKDRIFKFTTDKERIEAFYNDSVQFPNIQPGFIKNYLKLINDHLEAEKHIKYTTKLTDEETEQLKTSTLYVPNYLLGRMQYSKNSEVKQKDPDELMSQYKYDYEFIEMKDLSELILKSDKTFYYALYLVNPCGGGGRFFIVNNRTGEIIYAKTKANYVSSNDFKLIIK